MNVNVDTEAMRARLEDRMNELIRRTGDVEAHLRRKYGLSPAQAEAMATDAVSAAMSTAAPAARARGFA